jgi:hypothetical protein
MPKAKSPAFDAAAAHKYFAAQCFNSAWDRSSGIRSRRARYKVKL